MANLLAFGYIFWVSNPRYRPRELALYPHDFGRRLDIEWRQPEPDWTPREVAQLNAAELQHRICFGVLNAWMPRSDTRKITTLAAALDVPYNRLQQLLTGHIVMQFEDFGRLYAHIGPEMELWLLRGENAYIAKAVHANRKRELEKKRGQARRASQPADDRGRPRTPRPS